MLPFAILPSIGNVMTARKSGRTRDLKVSNWLREVVERILKSHHGETLVLKQHHLTPSGYTQQRPLSACLRFATSLLLKMRYKSRVRRFHYERNAVYPLR